MTPSHHRKTGTKFLLILISLQSITLLLFSVIAIKAQTDDPVDLENLPLGDGKVSTAPQVGYIWSCDQRFNMEGGGAFAAGPWINSTDGTWNRLTKLTVDGEVEWANYHFTLEVVDGERVLTGNGLPNHPTGIFPIQTSDDAYEFDRNPNQILEQTIQFTLPLNPTLAAMPTCAGGIVGIMITGVPLFNGFDAEGRDAVAHEIQDSCHGHPQREGQYHYHDLSGCIEERTAGDTHSELVGYAFDGFGIYGFRGENGDLLTNADLDECHGHTHAIEWEGQTVEMYHYHATTEFPYSIGCFRGTAVQYHPPNAGMGGQDGQPPSGVGNGQQPPAGGTLPPPPGGGNGGNPLPPPGGGNPPPPPGG